MEIGIIFHWGLYSIPAYDNIFSLRRRKIKNGSEWYYGRLIEKSSFRPLSGHMDTKEYHANNYNDMDYFNLKAEFNSANFEFLFEQLINKHITYIILTTRHHDGFCLWNT